MQFTAEEYYRAGLERMDQARRLYHDGQSYALTMYCAGLSVECVLRALRWREDSTFEGRHDLTELLKASRLLQQLDEAVFQRRGNTAKSIEQAQLELKAAMNEVAALWHNALRFASEMKLKTFLHKADRLRGVKGDAIKKNSLSLLIASQTAVDYGVVVWTSRKKS